MEMEGAARTVGFFGKVLVPCEAVLQLFLGMSAMEVERDVVGYNACIGACGA